MLEIVNKYRKTEWLLLCKHAKINVDDRIFSGNRMAKKHIQALTLTIFSLSMLSVHAEYPRVIICCVIDGIGYHNFIDLTGPFKGGLKFIHDKGISYTNATIPLGAPSIAASYATISTGALPCDHGIIDDFWLDQQTQNMIQADDDNQRSSSVLEHKGTYSFGKSSHHLKADTLSDQLALPTLPANKRFTTYSLSFESAPAIFLAGKLGKPFWFDREGKRFTSSRAFFGDLPEWLISWNKINRDKMDVQYDQEGTMPTSQADALLADLAYTCFSNHLSHDKTPLFLWLGFNALSLRTAGHESLQERLYKLDKLLAKLIHALYRKVKAEEVLFIITSSQGTTPLPEHLQAGNFSLAQRLHTPRLLQDLDTFIYDRYGIPHIAKLCTGSSLYLDQGALDTAGQKAQNILKDLKKFLLAHPGIQDAWTFPDLYNLPVEATNVRSYMKNQLYRSRSGHLSYLVQPYTLITTPGREAYKTPYAYDTHVPLIIYQKGILENKRINSPVYLQHIASTLSHILSVPRPSAASPELLPGIITPPSSKPT